MLGVAEKTMAGLIRGVGKSAVRTALLPATATPQKRLYAAPAKTLPKGQVRDDIFILFPLRRHKPFL